MKEIRDKLIPLLKNGYATPLISQIAKHLKEPSATIHYNIKKLEKEGAIKSYKAVFDYKKIEKGLTCFALLSLAPDEYGDPERIANNLAKHDEVESVDICTGDWEIAIKVRVKDQEEYYNFIKSALSKKGITKIKTLTSLKQVKSEYVNLLEIKNSKPNKKLDKI